ncbi:MAG: histidine kinase N-terminal 7TM domain-containing protein, partial [Pseudomonadota bacterium]
MYSLLPSFVAVLFLAYGLYIFAENGLTRISTNFIVLCLTTFCWQITWAVLFQVHDPETALYLIKFGYLLILFLPTSLYGFLIEISEKPSERRYVYASYGFAALLGIVLFSSDSLIDGYYQYAFGYYPKAGTLHPIHILQTCLVVSR